MSGKLITRPWTRGTTLFDTASMEFAAAASQIDINAEPGFDAVAVNTQIRTHLMLAPRQLKPKAGMSLTADDLWLPGEQRWEGDLQVTQGDVTLSQGVDYDIQWTASGEPSQAPQDGGCLQVADGWTDGLPADGDAGVRGIRVILHDTDAVDLDADAPRIGASFVVRITKSVEDDAASGDREVNDWMTMRWTRNDDASMTGCSPNGVWVTSPRDPHTALGMSVTAVSPQVGLTGVADLPPIVWHARVSNRATGVIQVTAGFTANLDANGAVPARSAARSAAQQSTPIAGNRIQGARLSAVRTPAEVGDDIAYTFNILARGPNRDGTLTTVLRMPANEDDKAMRGEGCSSEEPDADGCTGPDGSWHDYSGAYSRYHGAWSLEEPVTLSDADSTPTQVRYSVDPVFSGNADDYTWLTWDQLQALEPSRRTVTAVELVSEFSALDKDTLTLAAANGTINLHTKGNRPDDTYVMWVGTPQFSHPDDGAQPTAPFPAQVTTVASSISGTLYNVVAGAWRMSATGSSWMWTPVSGMACSCRMMARCGTSAPTPPDSWV
ncbi:hypothetical protein BPULL_2008 [Bifidobacterium pullorum]|uniref:Uncharacterized protein n=1 Tax=Bifidobacterium pullorum TaxID=78448 RepID=A0A7V8HQ12_9BIFI|nr:hypothetical protein BPULL_2008 [Bifidobacterium pullorum]